MCAGPKAVLNAATAIAAQRSALAKFGEFIASLPGGDDELERKTETTNKVQKKTVQPRTKSAILLMMKLQRPAPYFANALLAAVDVWYYSRYLTLKIRVRTSNLIIYKWILFKVRGQGRRFDFKIWVQPIQVAKQKAPHQKGLQFYDCCRAQNFWNKNKCALAR